tara:strand:- start:338 stop:1612 length:1275 start_codon:yes stop_codon:yes gene_type:complete
MLKKIDKKLNEERLLIVLGFVISIYPLCFLIGSFLINLNTLFACIVFIIFLLKEKNFDIFKNKFFVILLFLWGSFIINLFFSSNIENSLSRTFGFVRFILLALSIKIFFEKSGSQIQKLVFKIWIVTFLVVTFDLIFEFIFGFNTAGFSSYMPGRLSGFLNQELKIGHLYSAIFLICSVNILYFTKKNYYLLLFILISIVVSIFIGERANFIRVFFMSIFFIIFFDNKNFIKKIIFLTFVSLTLTLFIIKNEEYNKRFWGQFIKPIIIGKVKTDKIEIKESFSFKEIINFTVYGANYDRAYRVFLDNKLFGVGIKNYRNESNKKKYENKDLHFDKSAASIHPHQVHLEFLTETGFFGYFSFLIFIFLSFYWSFKNFLKSKNLIIFASSLYLLFSLMPLLPTGSFFTTFGATLFWINYGLMINEK